MLQNRTKNAIVGGLVMTGLLGMFALSYGGKSLSAKASVGTYPIEAVFNRVDGLYEGDEVRLGGIRIGTVGEQTLDEYFRAHVIFNIDDTIRLPLDSSAAIHTDGLFGSKFVVLEAGGELDTIEPGGRIEYTQDAVVVGELLELIIAEGKAKQADNTPPAGANSLLGGN